MSTNRLEAFSDGVFAIAITLLVLDLHVPHVEHGLVDALLNLWPSYATYAVSFLVIGIIWVNHHAMFAYITRADRPLLFFNLLMLMTVAVIPFPTALLSEYIESSSESHVAAAVYGGVMVLLSISFNLLWGYATWNRRCIDERLSSEEAAATTRRFRISLLIYLAAAGFAVISAVGSLAIYAALAIFYVFDPFGGRNAGNAPVKDQGAGTRPGEEHADSGSTRV